MGGPLALGRCCMGSRALRPILSLWRPGRPSCPPSAGQDEDLCVSSTGQTLAAGRWDTALGPSPQCNPPHLPNGTRCLGLGAGHGASCGVRHTGGSCHHHHPQHRPRMAVIESPAQDRPVAHDDTSAVTEKHARTKIHSKRCCPLPSSCVHGPRPGHNNLVSDRKCHSRVKNESS